MRAQTGYRRSRYVVLFMFAMLAGLTFQPFTHTLGVATRARAATNTAPLDSTSNPIQHVVYIIKENRSFDNYFGAYPGIAGHVISGTNYAGGATTATTF